ncbi:hypothetical protein GJ496_005057 [Pomphorhynchus laevis]|nr:hypothetical protein GJ496_005057 [Pomphorhynchus laevis]
MDRYCHGNVGQFKYSPLSVNYRCSMRNNRISHMTVVYIKTNRLLYVSRQSFLISQRAQLAVFRHPYISAHNLTKPEISKQRKGTYRLVNIRLHRINIFCKHPRLGKFQMATRKLQRTDKPVFICMGENSNYEAINVKRRHHDRINMVSLGVYQKAKFNKHQVIPSISSITQYKRLVGSKNSSIQKRAIPNFPDSLVKQIHDTKKRFNDANLSIPFAYYTRSPGKSLKPNIIISYSVDPRWLTRNQFANNQNQTRFQKQFNRIMLRLDSNRFIIPR